MLRYCAIVLDLHAKAVGKRKTASKTNSLRRKYVDRHIPASIEIIASRASKALERRSIRVNIKLTNITYPTSTASDENESCGVDDHRHGTYLCEIIFSS